MRTRAWLGALVAASLAFVSAPARADTPPSLWDSVKSPGARDRYALHVQAQRTLTLVSGIRIELQKFGQLDHLRAVLEENGAATSPDIRLRCDLGETYEKLDLNEEAVRVLAPVVAAHASDPAVLSAIGVLASAYAKLNRRREERDTYLVYLRYLTVPAERLRVVSNLAEADMGLLDMKAAVAGYEDAITLATQLSSTEDVRQSLVLAEWGLAVALDRIGDRSRAKAEAKKAIALDPGMRLLNHWNVFFVPAYERLWYIALGAAAAADAEAGGSLKEAVELRNVVESCFVKYAAMAKPDDPWLPLAKVRLAEAEKLRAAAEKKLAAAPKKAPPPDPDKVFTF